MVDNAPRVLAGRYEVGELIGRGGMAEVHIGHDTRLGRTVAIKILRSDLARDPSFLARFRREAQAAAALNHPAIVAVYDTGEDTHVEPGGGTAHVPFIVMEYVEGHTVRDILGDGQAVPIDEAIEITAGVLSALEYSHHAGIVHRDIKPGNVMVTDAGQVKVMDFGIARAVSDSSSTVAETTQILGTAAYFSPEQAKGEPVDARADVYSTGVVLYELLTGRQPFRGDSPVAVAYQHVSEAPVPPSEVNDTVPRALDTVALRALAKDPFQRYQDAAGFREALDATVDGRQPSKRQVGALTSELYGPNPRQAAETARSLRQLSTDTTMKRTQAGPPVAWIWAGVALLAVLLISLLFWVLTIQPRDDLPDNVREVPDVSGMTYERANEALAEADLRAIRVDEENTEVAAGNVIRTDPEVGTSVTPDQQVSVYVSTGQQMSTVPTLVGLGQDAATSAITAAGLQLGTVISQNDKDLAAGTVISSDPVDGASVAAGTMVNLVVASGRVAIDDVRGYTVDAATRELEDVGLTVTAQEDPNCAGADPPTVQSQSLTPGDVPVHSQITLVYCSGS